MLALIIGAIAGAAVPFGAPHIRSVLASALTDRISMTEAEFQTFCYAVMLVLGGVVVLLIGGGSALMLALGGFLGRYGGRLYNTVRNQGEGL